MKLTPMPPLPRWLWFHVGRNNAYYNRGYGCLPPKGVGLWGPLVYRVGYLVGTFFGPADRRAQ